MVKATLLILGIIIVGAFVVVALTTDPAARDAAMGALQFVQQFVQ